MQRVSRLTAFIGTALIVFGLGKLHSIENHYDFTGTSRFAWSIAYVAMMCLTAYGTGLPDLVRGRRRTATTCLVAPTLAALGISIAQLFLGDALLPRTVVLGSIIVTALWYLLCVGLASGSRSLAEERDRVFVVGDLGEAEILRMELTRSAEHPAQLVGACSMADLGPSPSERLRQLVANSRATVLVMTREAQADEYLVHRIAALHEAGVRVRTLALFHEQWLGKLPISELERVSLMFDIGEIHRVVYGRVARVFDVLLALLGFLGFVVMIPFVLVGNIVANRGPLFYQQDRVGKNGKIFRILKFRTMSTDRNSNYTVWTTADDPRVTTFGRVLRRTHIDEVPQVWNILRGHLSVVGPRPEQPHYVMDLVAKIPFYTLRHLVRPGLTGWAQVKYGYAGSESDALEKLQYEFYYLRHQSLLLDFRIVGRTLRNVFGGSGR